jgi:hypothetical protein
MLEDLRIMDTRDVLEARIERLRYNEYRGATREDGERSDANKPTAVVLLSNELCSDLISDLSDIISSTRVYPCSASRHATTLTIDPVSCKT